MLATSVWFTLWLARKRGGREGALTQTLCVYIAQSSSSRMRVMNHNWSLVSHETASSSAECSRDKPPFSFVRGQDSTMWNIIWISPQGHRSTAVSVCRHFLLRAPQCPCSVRKRFSRDHCYRGRSKPGCQIVGSHTRWQLTTWADFQLCLHHSVRHSKISKELTYV